ncbi:hypothetical protein [Pseudozobellia sp. WGM2]|uniref:hypothetical protein n=1 Tax=Pseudozobellia sp. WGM2 TaxID=2787625 RepID=UPI001ADED136|nr:hypothetical protein [Pseudozobellia sp. WGM2]
MGRYIFIGLCFVLFSCGEEVKTPAAVPNDLSTTILNSTETIVAGETVTLEFDIRGGVEPILILEKSFGPLLFHPKMNDSVATFSIPASHIQQSGVYNWQLTVLSKLLEVGEFKVLPKTEKTVGIETYFGPRSIRAGGDDFSMLFMVPVDIYDNPLPDGTVVSINKQMDQEVKVITALTKNGYVWKNLFSSERAGRMLVNTSTNNIHSKELTSMISPSNSVDFKITYNRVHDFADGNQVVIFKTDQIKDRFGNTVSDGTLVNFSIEEDKGTILKTKGSTIDGVATGRILHPTEASDWRVTAYITGEAKSNDATLSFRTAVGDFEVQFSENNRFVRVGPILGFMDQLVPDGLLITLEVYDKNGKFIEKATTNSSKGIGLFDMEERFFPNDDYKIKLTAAGIQREFQVALTSDELE